MTITTEEKLDYSGMVNFLKLKCFIKTFGKQKQILGDWCERVYYLDNIPDYASLTQLGGVAKRLQINIGPDRKELHEEIDIHTCPITLRDITNNVEVGCYEDDLNPESLDKRALCWLEKEDFLLWAVRNGVEQYFTYSEKLVRTLNALELILEKDYDAIPERFDDIRKDLPEIYKNGNIAERIFSNDDFLIWAIHYYLDNVIEMPF